MQGVNMMFLVLNSLKSAFHHIYRYLVEKHYENQLRYLVDKDLSSVQRIVLSVLSTFWTTGATRLLICFCQLQDSSGLEKDFNSSLSFGQAAVTFYFPEATSCLS